MQKLAEGHWDYIVWEHEGRLFLDVLCGSVGLFDVVIELNEEERALWEREGVAGVMPLIHSIRYSPQRYFERRVPLPE